MAPGAAAQAGISGAQNLRSKHGIPPDVPLPDVLEFAEERCGVPVVVLPRLTGDCAGGYWRKGDRSLILVSAEDPAPRVRFTIAHELGHHYFKHLQRVDELTRIHDTRESLRQAHDWWEVQANAFAAELLIPGAAVERWHTERRGGPIDLEAIVDLACRSGTSLAMSRIRLVTAGLLTDDEPLQRAIDAGEADELVAGHTPYEDGVSLARANPPRVPAALSRSKFAAIARGEREPDQASLQLGRPAEELAGALKDLGLLPLAPE